ncbi:hypothetical protein Bca4012_082979 [Brassica carinata]
MSARRDETGGVEIGVSLKRCEMDMITNPMDWPSFATEIEMFQRLQEDFEDVSLSHISRSRNGRADALAKEARTRGYMFSHINQIRTDGDALRRIGSSVLHLI